MKFFPILVNIFIMAPFYTLFFSSLFGMLWVQMGVEVDNIELDSVKIENISFQFDNEIEKFILTIDKIDILEPSETEEDNSTTEIDYKLIQKALDEVKNKFSLIEIKNINIMNKENLYFSYNKYNKKHFLIKNSDVYLYSNADIKEGKRAILNIKEVEYKPFNIHSTGNITVDLNSTDIFFKLKVDVNRELKIDLNGSLDNKLNTEVSLFTNKFSKFDKIFPLFINSPAINTWVINNKKNGSLIINSAYTKFNINDPMKALDNLILNAEITDFVYKFDEKLAPANSKKIDLKMVGDRIKLNSEQLNLKEISLKKVEVNISDLFNDLQINLKLNTQTALNGYIFKVLENYGVSDLPVKQTSGNIEISSQINLIFAKETQVDIFADARIKKAIFKFDDQIIKIHNTRVKYQNGKIKIYKAYVNYNEMAQVYARGNVDLNSQKIAINGSIDGFKIQTPEQNTSSVLFLNSPVFKVNGHLDKTLFVSLGESDVSIQEDINISISPIFLSVNIPKSYIRLQKIEKINIPKFNTWLSFYANFNYQKMVGNFYFNNLNSSMKTETAEIFKFEDFDFKVYLKITDDLIYAMSKELELRFAMYSELNKMTVKIESLLPLIEKLPIVQKYGLKDGNSEINIDSNTNVIDSNINLNIEQNIITDNLQNNQKIKNFNIKSQFSISDNNLTLNLNNRIFVNRQKEIDTQVYIENYDINVTAITKLFDDNSTEEKPENKENFKLDLPDEVGKIVLNYHNGKVFLTDSGNIFEFNDILVTADKNRVFGHINYKNSNILLELFDDRFILKGMELSGDFIKKLSNFHDFKRGKFNLYVEGDTSGDVKLGFIQLQDLVLKNFSLYNNIISMINAIPALLTLSRPGFNGDGFVIIAGLVFIEKHGNLVQIPDVQIFGESVNVMSKGNIDLEAKKLDIKLDISAIKYVDKLIGKIPVVNHMFLGEDETLATSLKIDGNLTDPNISIDIDGKSLIDIPVEIGKRILSLPAFILKTVKEFYSGH
jgi:hypothetical protein